MNTLFKAIKESLLYDVNTIVLPYITNDTDKALEEVIYFVSTYVPSVELLPNMEGKQLLEFISTILELYGLTTKSINELIKDFS
mgnify:CR=1 FL=1